MSSNAEFYETANRVIDDAMDTLPSLELLVNCASRYDQASIAETTPALFDAAIAVNLRAPFFLIQSFARRVQRGHVINIIDNKIGFNQPAYAAYLLSKNALAELTRLAALELAPHIRVNGVAPGVVLPAESRSAEYLEWRASGIPLKRRGAPADIVGAIRYLLGSSFVTGQILTVDGGESIAYEGRHAANAPRDDDAE